MQPGLKLATTRAHSSAHTAINAAAWIAVRGIGHKPGPLRAGVIQPILLQRSPPGGYSDVASWTVLVLRTMTFLRIPYRMLLFFLLGSALFGQRVITTIAGTDWVFPGS